MRPTTMACDIRALVLYSIDALAEREVVSLANHVARCRTCRERLTDREELKAAILDSCGPRREKQRPLKDHRRPRTAQVAARR